MIGSTRQTSANHCPNRERSFGFSLSLRNNQRPITLACQLLTEVSVGGNRSYGRRIWRLQYIHADWTCDYFTLYHNIIHPNPSNSKIARYKFPYLIKSKSLDCSADISVGIILLARKARSRAALNPRRIPWFHRPIRHQQPKEWSTIGRKKCNRYAQRHNQWIKKIEDGSCTND